jgi:hypothetical protein
VAAIASTRIASGGGISHKPQTNDAGTAGGTDASSPFQQFLSTAATAPTQGSSGQSGQTGHGQTDTRKTDSGKTDSGKKSGKDAKIDGKAGQAQQAANQIIAAADSKTLIQAGAASDDGLNDADSSSGTAASSDAAGTGQDSDPSAQQTAADASQTLAATQIPAPDDGKQGQKPDAGNGDTLAAILESAAQKSGAATQNVPVDGKDDTSSTSTSGVVEASKSGKGKQDGKDVTADPGQTKDATATAQSDVSKKDHKSAKTRDQDSADAANGQATPPVDAAAIIAFAAPPPTPGSTDADTDSSDAIAAAPVGQAKGAAKNSQANSNPPAGAKLPAPGGQASGDASKTNSAGSPANASSASQGDGAAAQGSDASQSADNKSAASAGDKSDNQTSAAPAQPQIQAAQPQPQPQAGVLPAVQPQQAHIGATDSITQNVQVAQGDPNANANTVGAMAVAIAAKSQSGNKQFDIRLDPPELGRVEVRLSIDTTGKVQASLSADQPRTLDLLKTDAPALTRALRDAGLNVSQNGLNFSLRGQNQQNSGNSFTPRSGRAAQSLIATSAIGSMPSGANYQGPADGRLDIRV